MRPWNKFLWVIQGLLALVFLFVGGLKLMPSVEALQKWHLPLLFMRFIGVCEVAGALGLILPGVLKIRPWLTPLAAVGLVIIMVGAVWVSVAIMGASAAVVPLVVGLLCALVAYGRARLLSRRGASPVEERDRAAHGPSHF